MFEEIQGIPMHPLLVHAAVVFVPVLALLAIGYAAVPRIRGHVRWVLAALAVITPFSVVFAVFSGSAFYDRLKSRGRVSEEFVAKLDEHGQFGSLTMWVSIVLGLAVLGLVFLVPPRGMAPVGPATGKALTIALSAVAVLVSLAAVYYVVRTGDSGAKAVWEGS